MDPELAKLNVRMGQLLSGERRTKVVRASDPLVISVWIESDEKDVETKTPGHEAGRSV